MSPTGKRTRGATSTIATMATVLALALAGLSTVPAPPAGAATERGLPPLPAGAPPERTPQISHTGDFTNPPPPDPKGSSAKPSSFDPARSVPLDEQTTPTRRVWRNGDGTETEEVSLSAVRFKDPQGRWVDIDTTIVPGPDDTLVAKAAPGAARLRKRSGDTEATVDTAAGPVMLRHPGAQAVAAAVAGDHANYRSALGGRDLELVLTPDGFKETVVIGSAAAGPSYRDELVLPPGASARTGDAGVEILDATGTVLAGFGGGVATDARFPAGGVGTQTPVAVRMIGTAPTRGGSTVATVEVSIDPGWLAAPERAFPVRIDPTFFTPTPTSPVADTWVMPGLTTTQYSSTYLAAGGGPRSLLRFNVDAVKSPERWVTSSHLRIYNWWSPSCTPNPTEVYGLAGPGFGPATVWTDNHHEVDSAGLVSTKSFARGASGCAANWENLDTTTLARRWVTFGGTNYGMVLKNDNPGAALKYFMSREGGNYAPTLSITYERVPTTTAVAPANGSSPTTATPILAVNPATDPDPGDVVRYWFRATPVADAESGIKAVDSGWLTAAEASCPANLAGKVCYTAPAGALEDGVVYHWRVILFDGVGWRYPDWIWSFRVDLRLGTKGPFPQDQVGPVSVNLVGGNLVAGTASPTFPTASGAVGLTYT